MESSRDRTLVAFLAEGEKNDRMWSTYIAWSGKNHEINKI